MRTVTLSCLMAALVVLSATGSFAGTYSANQVSPIYSTYYMGLIFAFMGSGVVPSFIGGEFVEPGGLDLLGEYWSYSGVVSNYSSHTDCYVADCSIYLTAFSADLSAGEVHIGGVNESGVSYEFTGVITGGGFYGYSGCSDYGWNCPRFTEYDSFSFSGTWSNGWTATGSFFNDPYGHWGASTGTALFFSTATPEPSTIALLVTGLGPLGYLVRRKLARD